MEDFDTFCNSCTDEVILLPPNMKQLNGKEAMKKLTKPWFETYDMTHEIDEIRAKTDVNTAYASAEYVDTITPKQGGESIVTPNKAIYILRRESDGAWKATNIIWNRSPQT